MRNMNLLLKKKSDSLCYFSEAAEVMVYHLKLLNAWRNMHHFKHLLISLHSYAECGGLILVRSAVFPLACSSVGMCFGDKTFCWRGQTSQSIPEIDVKHGFIDPSFLQCVSL